MKKSVRNLLAIVLTLAIVAVLAAVLRTDGFTACENCDGSGLVDGIACEACEGAGKIAAPSPYYSTFMALLPPIIAIALALITREAYSSLFIGIIAGALFNTDFSLIGSLDLIINNALIGTLASAGHVGILLFLVILGVMVALVNAAGGSASFGRWAQKHIKTRVGAQLSTFALGVLIFVDDYFNCLTVGSVMKPVTDSHKVSRAKLAYLIDATAAPICMIAPISSWAAAVAGVVENENGLTLFISAIPYNFYSLLTIVMIIALVLMKFDYGPMKKAELNAQNGDLFSVGGRGKGTEAEEVSERGRVIDLILPVGILIISCVAGMLYTGGFFSGTSFIEAFAGCDATVGLPWGALIALIITIIYLLARRVISFEKAMSCIPKGFIAMVPAILILSLAWALSEMTGTLGADVFVAGLMKQGAAALSSLLPAIIFLVAMGLAFATGTSWGTFGILIPIVTFVFAGQGEILIIGISACLAGAVCGDHCSPISDTTIMSSAGAECNHVLHVSTQIPYSLTVAGVSFLAYILAGFVRSWYIVLPIATAAMVLTLFVIKKLTARKAAKGVNAEA